MNRYVLVSLMAIAFLTQCKSVPYDESEKGVTVYPLARTTSLSDQPGFVKDKEGVPSVSLGEALVIQKTTGDWALVAAAGTSKTGWVHKQAVTHSADLVAALRDSAVVPKSIILVQRIKNPDEYSIVSIVGGISIVLKAPSNPASAPFSVSSSQGMTMFLVLAEGDCVTMDGTASRFPRISIKTEYFNQTIANPVSGKLYCYSPSDKQLRPIDELLNKTAAAVPRNTEGSPNQHKKGVAVYPLAQSIELKQAPRLDASEKDGSSVSLGERLVVEDTADDWVFVLAPATGKKGWVHKEAVTNSADHVHRLKKSGFVPTNIVLVDDVKDADKYSMGNIAGYLRFAKREDGGIGRAIIEQGDCVVFGSSASRFPEIRIFGVGLQQAIAKPVAGRLYCYSVADKKLRPVDEMLKESAPDASRKSVPSRKQKESTE